MNKIKILPKNVYSKIAAGEVVERPCSIVRELIDNSIDSGASEIIINVEKGGIKKITVSDNGCGIQKDDMPLALSMHATSKIDTIDDLLKLSTMGFRGEALYSIQTVSKLAITSNIDKTGKSAGYKVCNFTEIPNAIKSVAHKKGTKLEVEDIFYNLPARKKFLKSTISEWNAIKKIVSAKALSTLNISFRLYHNNELIFVTKGNGDFQDTFFSIYKNESPFSIHNYFKEVNNNLEINLYYSTSEVFFPNRKYQILFVNGRPVIANFFYASIDSGVRNYISPGRHPLIYLYLKINPELTDINIHPAKKEIKFYNQNDIFIAIQTTIGEAMGKIVKREILQAQSDNYTTQVTQNELNFYQNNGENKTPFDYFNEVINKENNYINETRDEKDYQILGVVFDTYILVQKSNRVFFIDQHAACESIIFSRKKEKYSKTQDVEILIIPTVFDIDNWNDNIDEKIKTLNNNKFQIEKGEGTTIVIRELPAILLNKKNYDTVVEIIRDFLESSGKIEDENLIDSILIEASCKEAIKKGDKLSLLEITEIVDEYFLMGITNCPHGRPTHFELTKDNLEKVFQRKK